MSTVGEFKQSLERIGRTSGFRNAGRWFGLTYRSLRLSMVCEPKRREGYREQRQALLTAWMEFVTQQSQTTIKETEKVTFTPVFPELELTVTKLLNDRMAMGLYATILSDWTSSATGEVFVRKVVIADPQGLHTISQFCLQKSSGEADCFGLSKDSVSAMDARKYMEYLGAQEQNPVR